MRRLKTAIVLGGGGARGAYEAGVISYLREELEPLLGRELKLDVITGTSVGAIHACFLAATSDQPATQGRRLTQPWLSTQLDRVLEFGVADIWRLIRESVGRPSSRLDVRQGGLANPDGLRKHVTTTIPWLNIGRNTLWRPLRFQSSLPRCGWMGSSTWMEDFDSTSPSVLRCVWAPSG